MSVIVQRVGSIGKDSSSKFGSFMSGRGSIFSNRSSTHIGQSGSMMSNVSRNTNVSTVSNRTNRSRGSIVMEITERMKRKMSIMTGFANRSGTLEQMDQFGSGKDFDSNASASTNLTELIPMTEPIYAKLNRVSVVFCDVDDFDTIVELTTPVELVALLDQLFTSFDRLCARCEIAKVETVGKTYMACSGLPEYGVSLQDVNATHAKCQEDAIKSVFLAHDILALMKTRSPLNGSYRVKVSVGINTGEAICGVVGTRKPQYAIFGDTVNTASRMQSTGRTMQVHVSHETYLHIADDPRFLFEQLETEAKGKGLMKTYLVDLIPLFKNAESFSPNTRDATPGSPNSETLAPMRFPSHMSLASEMSDIKKSESTASLSNNRLQSVGSLSPRKSTGGIGNIIKPTNARSIGGSSSHSPESHRASRVSRFNSDGDVSKKTISSLKHKLAGFLPSRSLRLQSRPSGDIHSPTDSSTRSTQHRERSSDFGLNMDVTRAMNDFYKKDRGNQLDTVKSSRVGVEDFGAKIMRNFRQTGAESWIFRFETPGMEKLFRQAHANNSAVFVNVCFLVCFLSLSLQFWWMPHSERPLSRVIAFCRVGYFLFGLILLMLRVRAPGRQARSTRDSIRSEPDRGSIASADDFEDSKPRKRMPGTFAFGWFWVFGYAIVLTSHIITQYDLDQSWRQVSTYRLANETFLFTIAIAHLSGLFVWQAAWMVLVAVVFASSMLVCEFVFAIDTIHHLTMADMIFVIIADACVEAWGTRNREWGRRTNFSLKFAISEGAQVANDLLDSLLPTEVLAEAKSGRLRVAYQYQNMTMLYADIAGFTKWSASVGAPTVMRTLTALFASFDAATAELGVYKVHTIGDCYVVVNQPRTCEMSNREVYEECRTVVEMGLRMLLTLKSHANQDLAMRIGIHVGNFVAGVIGLRALRFDIWGPDVLAANKVESAGTKNKICVSDVAMKVLQTRAPASDFKFTQKEKEIKLKDKTLGVFEVDGPAVDLSLAVKRVSTWRRRSSYDHIMTRRGSQRNEL